MSVRQSLNKILHSSFDPLTMQINQLFSVRAFTPLGAHSCKRWLDPRPTLAETLTNLSLPTTSDVSELKEKTKFLMTKGAVELLQIDRWSARKVIEEEPEIEHSPGIFTVCAMQIEFADRAITPDFTKFAVGADTVHSRFQFHEYKFFCSADDIEHIVREQQQDEQQKRESLK